MTITDAMPITRLNYKSHYTRTLEKGDVKGVVKDLIKRLPAYATELKAFQARIFSIESQEIRGVVTREEVNVAMNKINQAMLVFLDEMSMGNADNACRNLLIGEEGNPALDNLISSQLEFSQKSVKENSVFRAAVGIIFLAAVLFSVIVTYNHFEFLRDDKQVVALVALNILLYVCIGLLALYALSLIIKGSKYNQWFLKFAKQSST